MKPYSVNGRMALKYGVSIRCIQRLNSERLAAMGEEARSLLIGMAKQKMARCAARVNAPKTNAKPKRKPKKSPEGERIEHMLKLASRRTA